MGELAAGGGAVADALDGSHAALELLCALPLSRGAARHGQGDGADEQSPFGGADVRDARFGPGPQVAAQGSGVGQR
ncbi:hypothetical protein GCM10020254_78960 [Streptomyces goshikiensis]